VGHALEHVQLGVDPGGTAMEGSVRRPQTVSRQQDAGRRWPVMSMSPTQAVSQG
jgi:hypothetical protein